MLENLTLNFPALTYLHPWVFYLLPIAILVAFLPRKNSAVVVSASSVFTDIPRSTREILRPLLLVPLALIAITFLTVGAARPHQLSTVSDPVMRHNIMLSIDLSRSMATRDFISRNGVMSRLGGVKTVLAEFVKARRDDRIGLVVFGSNAYLQSPLTHDHNLLEQMVRTFEIGMAGDGTAIGDGLGLALQRVQEVEGDSKAIILLTDGVSNAGQVNPLKAAKVAADLGVKVHTIGIGSTDTAAQQMGGLTGSIFGQRGTEFDEAMLREIAALTGGIYRNADSVEGLQDIYAEIERLTKTELDEPAREVLEDLFAPYLLVGALAGLLYYLLSLTVFRTTP